MSEQPGRTMSGPALSTERRGACMIIWIDVPGASVNTLGPSLVTEFESVFTQIEQDRELRGVVIASGKPDSFIAGADVEQFATFKSPADAAHVSALGQELLNRLESLPVPFVAAIHGACLGAGLEVALACRYRVCTSDEKTVLALPEVQLGVIPGMGGTQRLPRLIGLQGALDMILAGRNIRPARAIKMGLVDEVVHPSILLDVALDRAAGLAEGRVKHVKRRGGAGDLLLAGNPVGRSVVFSKARKSVLENTHGHYPGAACRARRDSRRLRPRIQIRPECRSKVVRRAGDERRVAAARLSLLRPQRDAQGSGRDGRRSAAAPGDETWRDRRRLHGSGHRVRRRAGRNARPPQGHRASAHRRRTSRDSRRAQGAPPSKADHTASIRRHARAGRWHDGLLGLWNRRRRHRSGVRGSRPQAPGAARSGADARSDRGLRLEHEHHSHRPGSPKSLSIPSACSACTSSRRFTRCRCSR